MTIILMGVVAVAIIAGMIWLMMRIDRASSQRIERRREAWRAGGCVGPEPERSTLKVQEHGPPLGKPTPGEKPPGEDQAAAAEN